MDNTPTPSIPPELVEALEKLVPARCPGLDWPDRAIWHYAGKRELVEFLKRECERQQANILKEFVPST